MNVLVFIPGVATLLFTAFEMPGKVKKQFFRIPVWVSSSAIALFVGVVAKGVMGPMSGFVTELILFPGLHLAKKQYEWSEKRSDRKTNKEAEHETGKRHLRTGGRTGTATEVEEGLHR